MTYGEAMKAARFRAGLSRAALARKAGVTAPTICRMENGGRNGTVLVVEALADALGISIDEYIGHEVRRHEA